MSTPMTKEGYVALQGELDKLKTTRPDISEAIASARALGDLKENSAYHAARDQQGMSEARIRDIESKLADAQVIDVAALPRGDKVLFGVWIDVINHNENKPTRLRIVGADEANPGAGCISVNSPVAKALLGSAVGETVEVEIADSVIAYEIIALDFGD